jgi:hypothetical protein
MALRASLAALALLAMGWFVVDFIRSRRPYHLDEGVLAGWTLVTAAPGDAALVGLKPPSSLSTSLYGQLSERLDVPLAAPDLPLVPLVLRDEYSEGLQGVMSVDDILNVAREVGMDTARFEPVCVGRRHESAPGAERDVYFVLFDSPLFTEFRQQLTPLFPEHAGNGTYVPGALHPILSIAASDAEFGRSRPIALESRADCEAGLQVD